MVPHLKPYYCYYYKSIYVHKGMQVKPKVGSIITYVHSHLSYLFTFNFHTIHVLPLLVTGYSFIYSFLSRLPTYTKKKA